MILLDHAAGTMRTPSDNSYFSPEGSTTVIILERDGSLRHYPPDHADDTPRRAQVRLSEDEAQPSIIDKILDFSFDLLGISNLEVRVDEQKKR